VSSNLPSSEAVIDLCERLAGTDTIVRDLVSSEVYGASALEKSTKTPSINMSNENSPPQSPTTARRASFTPGQTLSQLFGRSPGNSGSVQPYPGPIAAAAANASGARRMSISTLGLSGSPTQTAPFAGLRARQDSYSTTGSGSPGTSVDESAIEEGDNPNNTPTTPFARRMSFGAKALRDVRAGSGNFNGRASVPFTNLANPASTSASPLTKGARGLSSSPEGEGESSSSKQGSNMLPRRVGEGFNWSDQLRSRAQRSSSINSGSPPAAPTAAPRAEHQRAASVAAMEPPAKEIPRAPKVPDAFQERILKGDFYMD